MVTNALSLLNTVGAAARLTRLVTRDTITQPARDRVLYTRDQRAAKATGNPFPPPRSARAANTRYQLHTLMSCDWCAGLWIAAAVTAAGYLWGHTTAFQATATALTTSYLVGWVAEHEPD